MSAVPRPHSPEGRDPTARVVVVVDQQRLRGRRLGVPGVEHVEHVVIEADVVVVTVYGEAS
jgi:hypothetical protein